MLSLFSGEDISVFLLAVFAKNEKTALNPKRRTALITAAKIGSRAAGDRSARASAACLLDKRPSSVQEELGCSSFRAYHT